MRRISVLLAFVLIELWPCSAPAADPWVGQVVFLKNHSRPKIGEHEVDLGQISFPATVEMAKGNWLWLGRAWVNKDDVLTCRQALEYYSEEVRRNPSAVASWIKRGKAWNQLGDHDKAIRDFTEVLRLAPDDALAYDCRGNAWAARGDMDKAIEDHSEAIQLDPSNPASFNNRGSAYYEKGNSKSPWPTSPMPSSPITRAPRSTTIAAWPWPPWASTTRPSAITPRRWSRPATGRRLLRSRQRLGPQRPGRQRHQGLCRGRPPQPPPGQGLRRPGPALASKARIRKRDQGLHRSDPDRSALGRDLQPSRRVLQQARRLRNRRSRISPRRRPRSPVGRRLQQQRLAARHLRDLRFRDGRAAVAEASKAVELSGGKWQCLATLAAAYADRGDFKKAQKLQSQAIGLAPSDRETRELDARPRRYKAKKAYRDTVRREAESRGNCKGTAAAHRVSAG